MGNILGRNSFIRFCRSTRTIGERFSKTIITQPHRPIGTNPFSRLLVILRSTYGQSMSSKIDWTLRVPSLSARWILIKPRWVPARVRLRLQLVLFFMLGFLTSLNRYGNCKLYDFKSYKTIEIAMAYTLSEQKHSNRIASNRRFQSFWYRCLYKIYFRKIACKLV